jgi:RimJ/RimL family protein N-acetyltransferase
MNLPDVNLRPFSETDLKSLAIHANNSNIANNLTDAFPHPYGEAEALAFIQTVSKDKPTKVFAIEINDQACGAIGLFPQTDIHKKNAEMGYWLAEPFWGLGIMSELIPKMITYGFTTWDIDRIFARPFGSNMASQRVLEKSGMILEARFVQVLWKNNCYEDELIYAIRRSQKA